MNSIIYKVIVCLSYYSYCWICKDTYGPLFTFIYNSGCAYFYRFM